MEVRVERRERALPALGGAHDEARARVPEGPRVPLAVGLVREARADRHDEGDEARGQDAGGDDARPPGGILGRRIEPHAPPAPRAVGERQEQRELDPARRRAGDADARVAREAEERDAERQRQRELEELVREAAAADRADQRETAGGQRREQHERRHRRTASTASPARRAGR
ncbi:MAG: hypothetical protein M5U28_55420 [Sandaracinaceae bacterium]|nr:hypothetical protein [Sandaracinaceae bacterium]